MLQPIVREPLKGPINPLHQALSTLDDEMRTILQRIDITDREKVSEYNKVLQRYLEYQDHHRMTIPNPTPSQPSLPVGIEEDVIRTVPKTLKKKAEAIMERIKRHPEMSWNTRGEFVYRGQALPGSNIVDLVNDVLRHRKTFSPHGWQDFARALRQTNTPQDMIGNRARWNWMHRESATSDAFSTAEEDLSPPLHTPRRQTRSQHSQRRSKSLPKLKQQWDSLYK